MTSEDRDACVDTVEPRVITLTHVDDLLQACRPISVPGPPAAVESSGPQQQPVEPPG